MRMFGYDIWRKRFDAGGGVATSLSELLLDLDLLFNAPSNRENTIYIQTDDVALADGHVDINGLIDRSESQEVSASAESDFTAGVDGFSAGGFSAVDGNIDSVLGEDDWLRWTGAAGTGQQTGSWPSKFNTLLGTVNVDIVRQRYRWAMPSGQVEMGAMLKYDVLTREDYSHAEYPGGTIYQVDRKMLIGNPSTQGWTAGVNDKAGKFLYLKDCIVQVLSGKHFIQASTALKPHANYTRFSADGDGVQQYFGSQRTLMDPIMSADTSGTFIMAFFDDGGPGNLEYIFTFGRSNGVGNFSLTLTAANKIQLLLHDNTTAYTLTSDAAISRSVGGFHTIVLVGTGSGYELYHNGSSIAFTDSGANGKWLAACYNANIDYYLMAQRGLLAYGNIGIRHFGYRSIPLTSDEITALHTFPEYQQAYTPS